MVETNHPRGREFPERIPPSFEFSKDNIFKRATKIGISSLLHFCRWRWILAGHSMRTLFRVR